MSVRVALIDDETSFPIVDRQESSWIKLDAVNKTKQNKSSVDFLVEIRSDVFIGID